MLGEKLLIFRENEKVLTRKLFVRIIKDKKDNFKTRGEKRKRTHQKWLKKDNIPKREKGQYIKRIKRVSVIKKEKA